MASTGNPLTSTKASLTILCYMVLHSNLLELYYRVGFTSKCSPHLERGSTPPYLPPLLHSSTIQQSLTELDVVADAEILSSATNE